MSVKDKIAIVTGASSGIGKATARLLARKGAYVLAADIETAGIFELAKELSNNVIPFEVNITKPHEVQQMVETAVAKWGGLDILFNNAGLVEGRATVVDLEPAYLDQMIDVNIKGVIWGCKYAIPALLKRGGGSIINNASVLGLSGMPEMAAYCATKGAVVALTRQVALDYAHSQVRVNCICPGGVLTEKRVESFNSFADPEVVLNENCKRFPLGRFATPEEVASVVLFLADDGSSFITGTILPVDGGCLANYNGV